MHSDPLKLCSRLFHIVIFAFLSSCLPPASPIRPPGYITVAIESNPTNLDPRFATDANSVRIGQLIFDSLTRTDRHSQIQPHLAQSWEMLDERTYVFKIREGIQFHNGNSLSAEDVKFTYESILSQGTGSPLRGSFAALESVNTLDRNRVLFRLRNTFSPFLASTTVGIIPRGFPSRSRSGSTELIGSGPFVLESFLPGEKVTLKANSLYWGGQPSVPGAVIRIIPDALVRVLEFKNGTVDLLQNDIEPDMLPWVREHTEAVINVSLGTTFQYLGMNLEHPILKNRMVRKALAFAIDREAVIRHLLKDQAIPASGLLSPLSWAYESQVERYSYNPGKAKKLLDEAGFRDPDGDGPRFRFKLSYKTTTLDLRRRIAEAYKAQLEDVGIELDVRAYEWGTLYGDIKKGNFHLYSLAWVGIHDPDIYFELFHSTRFPPNGDNRGRYHNPVLDRLLERGRTTQSKSRRKEIYSEVQKIVASDLPYISLWWAKNIVVANRFLKGFAPYPDGSLISLQHVTWSH